jgi:hypothetical protein
MSHFSTRRHTRPSRSKRRRSIENAANADEYGKERLAEAVKRSRSENPHDVLRRALEGVDAFSAKGTHEDDGILLVMKATQQHRFNCKPASIQPGAGFLAAESRVR